jgi:aminoglycoside-2''-adenylyltransferase
VLGSWEPATPDEVAELFSAHAPWWLAGGYAIELAVGHAFREHGDIDVLLLRRDQLAAQWVLAGWEWWAADPPGALRPWLPGEVLGTEVHDIWCRPGPDQPWRIQVMLDESDGDDWVSHRNPGIRRPVAEIGQTGPIPHLKPEIQLFYKAKNHRPKDDLDFATTLPLLHQHQRTWLSKAITGTYGPHPWLGAITGR